VIPFPEAMSRARDAGLDLVEVDANGQPPVCRILDYGKFKYEQAKRERDARKHQRGTMIHEVRLRPRTGQHDIDLKVRIARRLLDEGDKVKLSVMFRGREISHPEVGREVLDRAIEGLGETANIDGNPDAFGEEARRRRQDQG
jgi:translation initiation factor IF-3